MTQRWILTGSGRRLSTLVYRQPDVPGETTVHPVLRVEEVCRRLRKSRRQVYRYLRTGRLRPCVRVLGQWLFAASEVERFGQDPVPSRLRPFFWDVQLESLFVGPDESLKRFQPV